MSYRNDATIAFVLGIAALIFSAQFFPIEPSIVWALLLFVVGIIGIFFAIYKWRDVD